MRRNHAFHKFPGPSKKLSDRRGSVVINVFDVDVTVAAFQNVRPVQLEPEERRLRTAVDLQPDAGSTFSKVRSFYRCLEKSSNEKSPNEKSPNERSPKEESSKLKK